VPGNPEEEGVSKPQTANSGEQAILVSKTVQPDG
jgi:hypothetical protein